MIPNDVTIGMHAVDQIEIYFGMAKNQGVFSVANTKKKFHIQSNLHFIYNQNFYHDKQDEKDALFYEYHVSILDDLDHPEFI